jgi:hypothetical protein
MNSLRSKIIVLCMSAFFAFAFVGCEKEGPAEKAGKTVDQALDSVKEKAEEATE